ncbi:MAG: adenylate/guanylate cyclase domain-containing protein [Hyphomicrobiales bacterium]
MRGAKTSLVVSLLVIAVLTAVRATDTGPLQSLRNTSFDTLQRLWPRQLEQPLPVRVIDIDEKSLAAVGQWPWPRVVLARLTQRLIDLGVSTVAFDVLFPEPDRMSPRRVIENLQAGGSAPLPASVDVRGLPDNDEIFAKAIAGQPVVLAFAKAAGSTKLPPQKAGIAQTGADALGAPPHLSGATTNLTELDMAAAGIGGMTIDLAHDEGITRQIAMLWSDGQTFHPALSLEALRVAQGEQTIVVNNDADRTDAIESIRAGNFEIPVSESGAFHVYYRAKLDDLYVSAADVLNGGDDAALKERLDGAIVFIGTSAVGLLDTRTNALGQAIPGVSVHAEALEQMLSGIFLTRPEWVAGAELWATALAALTLAALITLLRPRAALAAFVGLGIATLALTGWAFRAHGLLVDATFPLMTLTAVFLTSIAYKLLVTERVGRQLRGAFAQYVAPGVLAEIERNPDALRLGGEMRDVTVMFVDIENFTPLSEKLDPVSLVSVVNRILDAGSKAILAEQGTIDKYIGDAIMAFWNAPLALPDHQYHAARAAIAVHKAIAHLNDEPDLATLLKEKGAPRISVRVGLASGPACVGNMGSSTRFDYSVVGETVNTAARTESACKDVGYGVAISGELSDKTKTLAVLPCGALPMKGRSRREAVHIIVGDENRAGQSAFHTMQAAVSQIASAMTEGKSHANETANAAVLAELADQHPDLESFFERLPKRLDDYRALAKA